MSTESHALLATPGRRYSNTASVTKHQNSAHSFFVGFLSFMGAN